MEDRDIEPTGWAGRSAPTGIRCLPVQTLRFPEQTGDDVSASRRAILVDANASAIQKPHVASRQLRARVRAELAQRDVHQAPEKSWGAAPSWSRALPKLEACQRDATRIIREQTSMNETILDLAERVAIAAYEKEVGTVNAAEANRLRTYLPARVHLGKSRRPITDALNAAHTAVVATKGGMHPRPHRASQDSHTPVGHKFSDTIDEVATERAAHYFSQADLHFLDMQHQQATESLVSAVICSIAAIAARNGWFHDYDGIHEAVELLATGRNPEITWDIHQALADSSELGHNLTSAFSAAMAQPDLVKFGMGCDSANGSDEDARNFARRAIQLAERLNAERQDTA